MSTSAACTTPLFEVPTTLAFQFRSRRYPCVEGGSSFVPSSFAFAITLWGEKAIRFNGQSIHFIGQTDAAVTIFVGTIVRTYEGSKELAGGPTCKCYINDDISDINIFRSRMSETNMSYSALTRCSMMMRNSLMSTISLHCPLLQTGAGKTYSMEGPSILHCNELKTGLVQRVVEIYLEKVRDLLDLSKDNLQIKESKSQGIFISGATEISIMNSSDALERLSEGIANRAIEETQMNLASSRSHCVYIFSVQHGSSPDEKYARITNIDS